ncbi:hypothetical protein RB594_008387 [Gaeumannomyces avenae]
MGTLHFRRVRRAVSFLARPLLFATLLSVIARVFLHTTTKPSPSPPQLTKALVVASTSKDDTSWLASIPRREGGGGGDGGWDVFHYVVDAPLSPGLTVPANKGNEAMVYLTYIVAHYDDLPDVVFFRHGHRRAWHQGGHDAAAQVRGLRAAHVAAVGFASARCLPGCENVMTIPGGPGRAVPLARFGAQGASREGMLATLLAEFLGSGGEEVPRRLAAPCCAQFAASRAAIRARPREWWVRLRDWLLHTPLDSLASGRLMEYTWAIWLGEKAE